MERLLKIWQLGTGEDNADLATGEWRQLLGLSGKGVETTMETYWVGSGDKNKDLSGREWRRQ